MKVLPLGWGLGVALTFACAPIFSPVFASEPSGQEFEDNETRGVAERSFAYSYGPEVAAIPAFADLIRKQEETALDKQKAQWNEAVEEFAELGCVTCVARLYTNTWEVAAQTDRFLILVSEKWTYTGGAHGNSFFPALGWDREAGTAGDGASFRPIDMFVSETALENTAFGEYCAALLEQKQERLKIDTAKMNPFEGCPSVGELVVTPLSSDGVHFDRIQLLAAPYIAGSFAEGPYAFDIPLSAAILAAVKPEFADHFIVPNAPVN